MEAQLRAFTAVGSASDAAVQERLADPQMGVHVPAVQPVVHVPVVQRGVDVPIEQRVVQLEERAERLSGKVQDIEAELRHVTAVASLQEVVATQLVRDAHDTMQANRGRNMVIFDPPPAPAGYEQLPADRKAVVRKDQSVNLCVRVQSAYEEQQKGKTPDKAAIRRYYELAIASTAEFFTRPSNAALPELAQAAQRNLVVSFTSQQAKIGFLSMNGALLKAKAIESKTPPQGGTRQHEARSAATCALRATHDLTLAERTAKQALTATMMELRTSGKRTAIGAHRGQAVLFVFDSGAGKQRDVYVWDADKGKAACMLRGMREDDWKQFVRTERPFPSSPCGYLGYDERPQKQRGFSDRSTHRAQQQTKRRAPRQRGGSPSGSHPQQGTPSRQGQQGVQRQGGQGYISTWVVVGKGQRRRTGEGREGQTGGARSPSQC